MKAQMIKKDPDNGKPRRNEGKPGKAEEAKDYAEFKKNDTGGRLKEKLIANNKSGQYTMGVGPRTGGTASNTQGGVPQGGTKKQVFKAKARVNKTAASPQAKRAARMIYKTK